VPLLVISPYAKPGYVTSRNRLIPYYTFDSMLAYIEHNFGLGSLTQRDANAWDLGDTLDYGQEPLPPLILTPRPVPPKTVPLMFHGKEVEPEGSASDQDDDD
jgi:hypothetical protein